MSLYDKLMAYTDSDYYPFHMPGHKRTMFLDMKSPFAYDITEIDGFDNLHEAEDILAEGMQRAAKLYQTLQTYYMVNGSTGGLLAGIAASVKKGDKILIARNCHKAVYNAVFLNELRPVYLYPVMEAEYQIAGVITPKKVQEAFDESPDIAAVVITSPTFDGVVSDVQAIADIVHANGGVLIVDEAHGAHFPFCDRFPESALRKGADLVIQSLHKTLPSLTQTAVIHRNSERVSKRRLEKYLSIYQTSSPSYVFMAGIDRCLNFLSDSKSEFAEYISLLDQFYEKTKDLVNLSVWSPQRDAKTYDKDTSKLILGVNHPDFSGVWLYEQLLNRYHIQPEMVMKDYVLCLSSIGDTKEGFDRLSDALHELDHSMGAADASESSECSQSVDHQTLTAPKLVYLPSEVEDYKTEAIELVKAAGHVTAEYIYLYPPGIPLLVPGEEVSKELLGQLEKFQKAGLSLRGMSDHSGKHLWIVKES